MDEIVNTNSGIIGISELNLKIAALEERLSSAVLFEEDLQFQPYIAGPPVQNKDALYNRACASDGVTLDTWLKIWLDQIKKNSSTYDVKANSVEQVFAKFAYKPVIIAGSGPSLKKNAALLKDRNEIGLVSCLHNYGFLEDLGVSADYYVNLDAGPITIDEMYQGGKKDPSYYWDLSKDRVLIAALTSHPDLLTRWKGKILFYNVMAPSPEYYNELKKTIDFPCFFSVGGNTLGACLYFAKAILGGCPITYVGADFSFGYDKKFHSWDSPYDKQYSGLMPCTDVFGNRRYTWASYYGFKNWFEYTACGGKGNQPGMYINCTEGGILGSYPEGNIMQIQQMTLKQFLWMYNLHKKFPEIMSKKENTFLF